MSVARPEPPPLPGRSGRRWPLFAAVAVVVALIAYVALSNVGNALVYYQTPSELLARGGDAVGQPVRLGGLVKAGTLTCANGGVDFVLADPAHEVRVATAAGATAFCPKENAGVVVSGRLDASGVFRPDEVIVKHDENYVAPTDGGIPSQVIDPGT